MESRVLDSLVPVTYQVQHAADEDYAAASSTPVRSSAPMMISIR